MAENAGRIEWDLDLDDAKFKSKLKGSHTAAQSFGSKIGGVFAGVGKAALKLGAVASAAFVGFSVLSVKAAAESQAALSQLNAVIKSTGGVAGVTSKAAIDLSKSLQKVTTFSDESVLEAENLLLTFTKIGKKIFPQATKTVLDMSIALGQDTKSSAIQLGKALQDPILGITALRRVGVNFNDKQKEVITNLVETGHSLDAQKLILKELQTEFGGSAEAASTTFGGALKQLNNALNDLQETFGRVIINAITPFVKSFAAWATSKDGENAINNLILGFQIFAGIIGNLITTVWPPFIATMKTVVGWLIRNKEIFIEIYDIIADAVRPVLKDLQNIWKQNHKEIVLVAKVLGITLVAAIVGSIVVIAKIIEYGLKLINVFLGLHKAGEKMAVGVLKDFKIMVNGIISGINIMIRGFNRLPKQIRFGVTIPEIPKLAKGINSFAGGLAMVGERGPELVNLPRGSSVIPNNRAGGDTYNINLAGIMARSRADLRDIGKDIIRAIDEERRAKGKAAIL